MPCSRRRCSKTSRLRLACIAAVAHLGIVAHLEPASAAEVLRIVLAASEPESTTSKRLEAELRSLGLTVITTYLADDAASRARLEQMARSQSAIGAVRVTAYGTKAELWIVDRVTNKTVLREIVTEGDSLDSADDSIAVGVAELLRASLIEANTPSRHRGDYPPTPKIRELAYVPTEARSNRNASNFWLGIGSGMELGVRGVGVSLGGQAAVGWQAPMGLGIEAIGGTTIVPAVLQRPEGEASLTSQWFGAAGTFGWEPRGSNVSARAGLGVMGVRIQAAGDKAASPLTSITDATWAVGPYLHAGPALGLGSFRIRLDAAALMLLNSPQVRFADEAIAVWGAPALFLTLGVETIAAK